MYKAMYVISVNLASSYSIQGNHFTKVFAASAQSANLAAEVAYMNVYSWLGQWKRISFKALIPNAGFRDRTPEDKIVELIPWHMVTHITVEGPEVTEVK